MVFPFPLIGQITIPEALLLEMGSTEVPLPMAVPSPEIPAVNEGQHLLLTPSQKRRYAARALTARG
jgi:hypothetical protein